MVPTFARYLEYLEDCYFRTDVTRQLGRVLKAYGKEFNSVPGSFEVLLQRVEREVNEGRLLEELRDDVEGWVLRQLIIGYTPPPTAGIDAELGASIRSRVSTLALDQAVKGSGKRGKLTKFAQNILAAEQIGLVAPKPRVLRSLADLAQVMREDGDLKRLSTGSYIIDQLLDGGLPMSTMGLILASSSTGKSFAMVEFAAAALIMGENAALCLLEGTERDAVTRLLSLLSGMNQDYVRRYEAEALAEIQLRWPNLGQFAVFRMEATGSTSAAILGMFQDEEAARGIKFGLLVIDYLDLIEGSLSVQSTMKDYDRAKLVARHLADYVMTNKTRLWTPIQSKRLQKALRQDLDLNDGADSQHKVRIADIVVALNKMKSQPQTAADGSVIGNNGDVWLEACAIKHRQGRSDRRSEVFKTELDRALVFPDNRFFPAYQQAYNVTNA